MAGRGVSSIPVCLVTNRTQAKPGRDRSCAWLASHHSAHDAAGIHPARRRSLARETARWTASRLAVVRRRGCVSADQAGAGSILVVAEVHQALEQQLGRKIAESTVYRILHRHGWRKLVPRPFHPKRKPEAAEAFKKGASQKSSDKPKRTPQPKDSR